jgi:hypothetical protein
MKKQVLLGVVATGLAFASYAAYVQPSRAG